MIAATLTILALTLSAGPARPPAAPKPNPYLTQAKVFHQGLEYEKCLQRLTQASRWPSTPREAVEIELYSGLCHYGLGHPGEAKSHFELAVELDPEIQLPPFTSPKIADLFAEIRERLTPPPTEPQVQPPPPDDEPKVAQAKPVEPAPVLTPSPQVVQEPPTGLFGMGPRGMAVPVAVVGVAAAGAGAYFGLLAQQLEQQANAARFQSDALEMGARAERNALIANVGYGVAGAAVTAAVIMLVALPSR